MSNRGYDFCWGNNNRRNNDWAEQGGYKAARCRKLTEQFNGIREQKGLKSTIFEGVTIYVNGYTDPSFDKLRELMALHGGQYRPHYAKTTVTHIIATSLAQSKIVNITDEKVVKTDWILDSIAAGKCLPCDQYYLFQKTTIQQPSIDGYTIPKNCDDRMGNKETSISNETLSFKNKTLNSKNCIANDSSDKFTVASNNHGNNVNDKSSSQHSNDDMFSGASNLCDNGVPSGTSNYLGSDKPLRKRNYESISSDHHLVTPSTSVEQTKKPMYAGQTGFLAEFYSRSRLHHISNWATDLRDFVAEIKAMPGRVLLTPSVEDGEVPDNTKVNPGERIIFHVDMDCFFVVVGLRSRPHLRGKPIAVTHSKGKGSQQHNEGSLAEEKSLYEKKFGRSVSKEFPSSNEGHFHSMAEIASCSYEARKFGVKNGMLMGRALELCPDLVTIPYEFEAYTEVSKELYRILLSYSNNVEVVSCDEAYLDVTDLLLECGLRPTQFATLIRKEVFARSVGCTASIGIGKNPLLARLATKKAKPDGLFWLEGEDGTALLANMHVQELPGVGHSTGRKLEELGARTCRDLEAIPLSTLQDHFGSKVGSSLYNSCRGKDDRLLCTDKERKSVSAEVNYGIRFTHESECTLFLQELAQEVSSRLAKAALKGRTVTFKLMIRHPDAPRETAKFMGHGVCNQLSKSVTLPIPTSDVNLISQECGTVLRGWRVNIEDIRGMGIQMHRLEKSNSLKAASTGQRSLSDFLQRKPAPSCSNISPIGRRHLCSVSDDHLSPPRTSRDTNNGLVMSSTPLQGMSKTSRRLVDIPMPSLPRPPPLLALQNNQSGVPQSTTFAHALHPAVVVEEELPSFSQVDQSVMSALPDDIRREIEAALAQQQRRKHGENSARTVSNPIKRVTFPRKNIKNGRPIGIRSRASPGKLTVGRGGRGRPPLTAGGATVGRGGRGRPPLTAGGATVGRGGRGRPPLLAGEALDRGQRTLTSFGGVNDVPTFDWRVQLDEEQPPQSDDVIIIEPTLKSNTTETPPKTTNSESPFPFLCQKSQTEINQILRRWVQTDEAPQPEDEAYFTGFLVFQSGWNLEFTRAALVHLRRLTRDDAVGAAWNLLYQRIRERIQAAIELQYGAPLALPQN